ncbi:hypothetical protein CPB83DRAFT_867411 [Crepidotus variabilis]|uniref:Integrase core domain-containing protein n=1 Tax=Crepidotus variabilis TaxID=179855 RepID=A0A9P6EPJ6_9AGAR|nr:hypothetical protein CPB83DRAFT_867411 [Crepidotus variabilis]
MKAILLQHFNFSKCHHRPTSTNLYNNKEIVQYLLDNVIDTDRYGLSYTSFRTKILKDLGLETTRGQGHTVETIDTAMQATRQRFPKAGTRDVIGILFAEHGISVVVEWCCIHEPSLVCERKARNLKRRCFWAAGVNDMLAVDQHDNWKRFGLALHTGIDPFSGRVHWIKIYWTNNNPKIVLSYYLEWVRIPLVTQSNLGSENYGIANGHTTLRHLHDPSLVGTIQHRWMKHKKNVKPEVTWSQLRRRFSPGFKNILEEGVTKGWYDINRPIDKLVFRWIFIPWLQAELNAYVARVNTSRKRADRNKVLPHGRPNDIHFNPGRFGCLDFKITVDPALVNQVEQLYAPPDDPVFTLVPADFEQLASKFYTQMGRPPVTSKNVWDVYIKLMRQFEQMDGADGLLEHCVATLAKEFDNDASLEKPVGTDLFGGIDELDDDGNYYLGGVNNIRKKP